MVSDPFVRRFGVDPDFFAIIPLTVISFSTALLALRMILRAWTRRGVGVEEIAELHSAVAELREENEVLRENHRADILELEERIDFAERLLAKANEPRKIEGEVVTPV